MKKVLVVVGTRPEVIKMAPVVKALAAQPGLELVLCSTGQHNDLVAQMLGFFGLIPAHDLAIMRVGQTLSQTTCAVLAGMETLLREVRPDLVMVHGDTASSSAAALAAYFQCIPVAHVEAGLRTGDRYSPWPEEGNRRITATIAELHCAPTQEAADNLWSEGIDPTTVVVTGNTVVDALVATLQTIEDDPRLAASLSAGFPFLDQFSKVILVTGHRRENFGDGLDQICSALQQLAERHPEVCIVYPVHPNPYVLGPVKERLGGTRNVFLIEPVGYSEFVYLMSRSFLILTDSGGVQEEAPTLGKPVLVMRDVTERPEAVAAGTAKLVGARTESIVAAAEELLADFHAYRRMSEAGNPFGDGNAAERVRSAVMSFLSDGGDD